MNETTECSPWDKYAPFPPTDVIEIPPVEVFPTGIIALDLLIPALKAVKCGTSGEWVEEGSVTITHDKRTGEVVVTAQVRLKD